MPSHGVVVRDSQVTMSQLMLPSDANPHGSVHGGTVLRLIDNAAGVAATRHTRMKVVTARLDEMSFLNPVHIGNLLTAKASVNATWTTSMEVGVRVESEDLWTGETLHVASAYLVFVGLGDDDRPSPVPPIAAESTSERRRMADAQRRRDARRVPKGES